MSHPTFNIPPRYYASYLEGGSAGVSVWPSVRENLLEKMTELDSKIDSDSEETAPLWNLHFDVGASWRVPAACLKDESVTGLHCRPIHPPTAFQSFHEPDRPVLRPHSTRHGGPASAQLGTTTYSAEYVTRTARPGAPARSPGPAVPPVSGPLANNTVGDIQYPGECGTERS